MKNQTIYKFFSILLVTTVLSTTLIAPNGARAENHDALQTTEDQAAAVLATEATALADETRATTAETRATTAETQATLVQATATAAQAAATLATEAALVARTAAQAAATLAAEVATIATQVAALAAEVAALASEVAAQTARNTAQTAQLDFQASRNTAQSYRTTAQSSRTTAQSSRTTAQLTARLTALGTKCVTNVLKQKAIAFATGLAVAALGWVAQQLDIPGVPTQSHGQGTGSILQSLEGGATQAMQSIKPMADCLIHGAAQLIISQVNVQTTGWIKSGLNGSPQYATNIGGLFQGLSQMVSGNLRQQVQEAPVCDFSGGGSFTASQGTPFTLPARGGGEFRAGLGDGVAMSTRVYERGTFVDRITCPFPDVDGARAEDYYGGAFTWGGFEASLQDSGNPFGVAYQTSRELTARTQETDKIQDQQLAISDGYLPVIDPETCDYPPGIEEYLNDQGIDADITAGKRLYCKTTTPGKVVSDLMSKTVGSDLDRLMAAKSVTTIMEGFTTQLIDEARDGIFK